MKLLDRPSSFAQSPSQVIEQRLVCGLFAQLAEVVRSADDPFAEVMLPDSIRYDPRRQGVVGGTKPARQLQTPASGCDNRRIPPSNNGGKTARDQIAKPVISAPDMD